MLRRDSATPRQYMSERFRMWDRMVLPHSVCRHQEFVKASRRESCGTHGTQVLTEPNARTAAEHLKGDAPNLGLAADIIEELTFKQANNRMPASLYLMIGS